MFVTRARHREAIGAAQNQLDDRDRRIAELEARVERAERVAHEIVEQARYTLESAALVLSDGDNLSGEALATVAHTLPYVFSGRRHWAERSPSPGSAESAKAKVQAITRAHGFELPREPAEAVISLLKLSSKLLVPSFSLPVEGLRVRYPVTGFKSHTSNEFTVIDARTEVPGNSSSPLAAFPLEPTTPENASYCGWRERRQIPDDRNFCVEYGIQGIPGDPDFLYVDGVPSLRKAIAIAKLYPNVYRDGAATHVLRRITRRDKEDPARKWTGLTHRWRVFQDGSLELMVVYGPYRKIYTRP